MRSVWRRSVGELTLRVPDPVDSGLIRSVAWAPDPALLTVRPCSGRDHERVDAARRANWSWLSRWEATLPRGVDERLPDLGEFRRSSDRQQRQGTALLMVVELDGEVAGLISLSNVQWGAMSQGMLGYWVTERTSGRGVGALAVAMVIDLVLGELGLHRIEVNVRPENTRSLGLCRKLGLRREGLKVRYMNIGGQWADHVGFAIDTEDLPEGGLVRSVWGRSVV